jgi:hypothetical protein
MIKGSFIFVFAAAFGLCAALGSAAASCSPCDCPAPPDRPGAQASLPIKDAMSYDSQGNLAVLTINPVGGTVEVTGDTVVVRYEEAGVQHEVTYSVTGP